MSEHVKIEVAVNSSNDAFVSDPTGESARILREIAADIDINGCTYSEGSIRDTNGNTVGSFLFRVTPFEDL